MPNASPSPRPELDIPARLTTPSSRGRLWAGVAVLAAGTIAYQMWGKSSDPALSFELAAVETRAIRKTVEALGTLDVAQRVVVPAPLAQPLARILVKVGEAVTKGQELGRLEDAAPRAALAAAQVSLNVSAARQDSARLLVKRAGEEVARLSKLVERGLATEQLLAAARAELEGAQVGLRMAQAELSLAQHNLHQAEASVAGAVLSSPIAGVVLAVPAAVGAMVGPAGPPLFEIGPPLTELQLNVSVAEADIGLVQKGQTARFTVPAYPGRAFEAKIHQVDSSPSRTSNPSGVSYPVRLVVSNADRALLPGMSANVIVEVAQVQAALSVPEAALRFVPAGQSALGERAQLWKHVRPGEVERVPVQPGLSDGSQTEVTLPPGAELSLADTVAVGYSRPGSGGGKRGPGISLGNNK